MILINVNRYPFDDIVSKTKQIITPSMYERRAKEIHKLVLFKIKSIGNQ